MKLTYIGHGYAISDKSAGELARIIKSKLPARGYALRVVLLCGTLTWLSRTPLQSSKRGWVWYVQDRGAS